jgi:general secretion pathway protein K
LLVTSFAFEAHIETRLTSYYRNRTKAEYVARGGLPLAQLLMIKSGGLRDAPEPEREDAEWWHSYARRLAQAGEVSCELPLGEGTLSVHMAPEPARRNVGNLMDEKDWEGVLKAAGVPEEMWPGLIDSAMDWTDPDDRRRADGAETEDYYAALDPPRMAKNAPLDTVGELLLVKGFTREIVFGGTLRVGDEDVAVSGLQGLLTVFGDGKVNVNAAEPRVLMTLPLDESPEWPRFLTEEQASDITFLREWSREDGGKEYDYYRSVDDFFSRVSELSPYRAVLSKYITTDSPTYYKIVMVGTVHGVRRSMTCTARAAGQALTVLRWEEGE